MTAHIEYATEQEDFWRGEFGDAYTDRNDGEVISRSNLLFWASILKRTGVIDSAFEIGCNRGLNLDAIKSFLPACQTLGLEINAHAAEECSAKGHKVFEGSILAPTEAVVALQWAPELAITSGVLIHINPASLESAYRLLYALSKRYILISEYFSPVPVEISYRGHANKLFKRDFAGEFWAAYPSLGLVDYGFVWSKDPIAPKDDMTWFLFEKQ